MPRPGHGPRSDDPAARERARDVLHKELDRGTDPEDAATRALDVSDECVEAWLVLADAAVSLDEARKRIRRAVEAATLVIGERGLRERRGHLGADAEGVDYLHALAALARVQTAEDRAEQAVQTLHGVLEMDPRDPAVVRGDLLLLLLALARDEEADELVARHALEANADWMYGRALVRRRRALDEASLARAGEALDRALEAFPAGADAILEEGEPGAGRPPALDPLLLQAYGDTEHALDWVRARRDARRDAPPVPSGTDVPSRPDDPLADRRFSALEHVEEAWEVSGGRREALARRALELWPDASDAWRAIASVTATPGARIAALREAVAASDRVLARDSRGAPTALPDDEDGRRARRAHHELVRAYLDERRASEAEAVARRLLVEDPEDTTHAAVELAVRLLLEGRDAEASALADAHADDASPDWAWLLVLLARRRGDRVRAAFALGEAQLVAPLVGEFLRLGRVPPRRADDPHDEPWREAGEVVGRIRPAWDANPDAIAWLRAQRPPPRPPSSRAAPGRP